MRLRALACVLVLVGIVATGRAAEAQVVTWNSVQLSWTTPGDDSLTGTASQFDLRYSTAAITAANFASATRWNATPVPGPSGTRQSTTVAGLLPNTTYWFAIKTGDDVPNWSGLSNVLSRATLAAPDTVRPAPIANVIATSTAENTAALTWNAVGDDSLTGTAASYDVRYSTNPITAANWGTATQSVNEPTPGAPGTAQSFTVTGLTRQTRYYFAVRVADDAGSLSALSNVPSATTLDLTRPAPINDLVVGFVWLGGSVADGAAILRSGRTTGRHRS